MAQKNERKAVHIILLAAGNSSRLGRPKQLLVYKGQTLLQYSLDEAEASDAKSVVVVLGANADILVKEIKGGKTHVVVNPNWQEGMASSIRTGITAVTEIDPLTEAVIVLLCDQPFMTAALLNDLIEAHERTNKAIVACSYGNTFGPPVFFHRSVFPELLQLKGDTGARNIVMRHTEAVEAIPFPEGTFDIDTEADYEKIKG